MTRARCLLLDAAKIAVELPIVVGLVLGGAWGLARWAEAREGRPLRAGADGLVVLAAPKATLQGELRLEPTAKEEQAGPFEYHFGRELDEERQSRRITHWSAPDDRAEWRFVLDAPGEYAVEVELEPPAGSSGGRVRVALAGQSLDGAIDASSPRVVVALGQLALDAGEHSLAVSLADAPNQTRLVRITLRPAPAPDR